MRKKIIIFVMCICMAVTQVNIYALENESSDLKEVEIEYDDDFLLVQLLSLNPVSWHIKII